MQSEMALGMMAGVVLLICCGVLAAFRLREGCSSTASPMMNNMSIERRRSSAAATGSDAATTTSSTKAAAEVVTSEFSVSDAHERL